MKHRVKARKTIAVFTSSRAEYSLFAPLMRVLLADPEFELRLLCGGAHLVQEFGMTVDEIRGDGFLVHREFPFLCTEHRADAATVSLGRLQQQIGEYFAAEPPDFLILAGDRFELLPVATAALLQNVPIVHFSGGEVTSGAIDNQVRNAVSKIAHLHLPATEVYRENLLRMGEEEWRICVVGEPALDLILGLKRMEKEELFRDLALDPAKPVVVCTFHPETIEQSITASFLERVVEKLSEGSARSVLGTASNCDPGGAELNAAWERLAARHSNVQFVKNLGQRRYYSLLNEAALMLGNSSSGLLEAQSFNLPVINVGNRQRGRLSNPNIVHVPAEIDAVLNAVDVATSEEFRANFWNRPNLYGDGHACPRALAFLHQMKDKSLLVKGGAK